MLDNAYLNLDFEIKIVEICWILSEIYFLKLNIHNFTSQSLAIFEQLIFPIFAKHSNDLHNICSVLSRQVSAKFEAIWAIIHWERSVQQHFGIIWVS